MIPWHEAPVWYERDGMISDGTPLRDVVAEMPVEVRESGTLDWRPGIVVAVVADEGFDPPLDFVRVELEHSRATGDYPTMYVRKRRMSEPEPPEDDQRAAEAFFAALLRHVAEAAPYDVEAGWERLQAWMRTNHSPRINSASTYADPRR